MDTTLVHQDFGTHGIAAAVVLGKRPAALAAARRAQVANAEYVRHFLDAHVKGIASAAAWLARAPAASARELSDPATGAALMRRAARALLALVSFAAASPAAGQQLRASAGHATLTTYRLQLAPRGSTPRIAAQIVGGALAAGLLGFVAWGVVDDPEGPDRRVKGDAGYTPNANTAYAAASFVGSTAAVYWIGRGDGSRASLAVTALGAGLATIPLALGRHEPYLPLIGLVLGAPAQAVGATLGYQLTRRER